MTAITRARAKIQNEYKLFHANDEVRRFRRNQEEYEREAQLATRPSVPTISIYCDESGKTGSYPMVGSMWVHDLHREKQLRIHFTQWKNRMGLSLSNEFHFTEMSRNELSLYKEFVNEFLSVSDMMTFVLAVSEHARGRSLDDTILELHYQLVHQGLERETNARRISLPRQVNFWKDRDDANDKLLLTKLEQHLVTNFKHYFDDKLHLSIFNPIDSKISPFIQIADIFTGSMSRLLNQPGNYHKDELAQHLAALLGVTVEDNKLLSTSDMVVIKNFY